MTIFWLGILFLEHISRSLRTEAVLSESSTLLQFARTYNRFFVTFHSSDVHTGLKLWPHHGTSWYLAQIS